jgi:hypothetical protein
VEIGPSVRTAEIEEGGSAGTVSLNGVLGEIVSFSFWIGELDDSVELDDLRGNLNLLLFS